MARTAREVVEQYNLVVWNTRDIALAGELLGDSVIQHEVGEAVVLTHDEAVKRVADHLAISAGIWSFGEGRHLGVYLGAVPVEEVLFFVLTSLLVSLGVALFTALLGPKEARAP